ncbi:hypothetical protein [Aliivibrio fischeri]|uniref:Uncharacterized protein n=1 Tax=Aliivibrio fischeri SR5 TaxID=1088719 RepID=A0AAV3EMR6_ALIFS|nr:hypothetical protein [Aliivibrio fischeri]EHN67929.1 hypothetical protein VFSR5_2746 [Aliivibrio fischeri SR5]MUL11835.1 hypothetical protein [Aliivibrio fischeri]MUL15443.1 hypothetical protein [Aliivibrio fischeri]
MLRYIAILTLLILQVRTVQASETKTEIFPWSKGINSAMTVTYHNRNDITKKYRQTWVANIYSDKYSQPHMILSYNAGYQRNSCSITNLPTRIQLNVNNNPVDFSIWCDTSTNVNFVKLSPAQPKDEKRLVNTFLQTDNIITFSHKTIPELNFQLSSEMFKQIWEVN